MGKVFLSRKFLGDLSVLARVILDSHKKTHPQYTKVQIEYSLDRVYVSDYDTWQLEADCLELPQW
jgi:hypothetical protein